jgi:bacteriocin-like protein
MTMERESGKPTLRKEIVKPLTDNEMSKIVGGDDTAHHP